MTHARARLILVAAALTLSTAGAALGSHATASAPLPEHAVDRIGPFAVADLLAKAPPDVVVITLDPPRHALRGAIPAAAFGANNDAVVAQGPRERGLILVGVDAVRTERLARRLASAGRRVAVLDGGVEAWDRAMDVDPPTPGASAPAAAWRAYRTAIALRRSFGDAEAQPTAPVVAPALAPMGAPAGAKKREGC